MTRKKEFQRKASFLRKILGIDLIDAKRIMKLMRDAEYDAVLGVLGKIGCTVSKPVITGICPRDGMDYGYYLVSRGDRKVRLIFSCCGLEKFEPLDSHQI